MKLYISSSCSQKKNIFDALEELAAAGFKNIELSGGSDFDGYTKKGLLQLRQRLGLTLLVHNYFPPQATSFVLNISSANTETRQNSMALVHDAIELSLALGQNHYGVHAGFLSEMSTKRDEDGVFLPGENITGTQNRQQDFIKEIMQTLPQGFKIALENCFPRKDGTPMSLLSTQEQILAHVEYYKDSPMGLLLDLGHLGVSAQIHKFDKYIFLCKLFQRWTSRIFEIHLSTHEGGRDTHSITGIDSPDVVFLMQYGKVLAHVPLVLEWQNTNSREAYMAYEGLLPLLS